MTMVVRSAVTGPDSGHVLIVPAHQNRGGELNLLSIRKLRKICLNKNEMCYIHYFKVFSSLMNPFVN